MDGIKATVYSLLVNIVRYILWGIRHSKEVMIMR